jgi:hypothetical protein
MVETRAAKRQRLDEAESCTKSLFEQVPNEVLEQVLLHIPARPLRLVCSRWRNLLDKQLMCSVCGYLKIAVCTGCSKGCCPCDAVHCQEHNQSGDGGVCGAIICVQCTRELRLSLFDFMIRLNCFRCSSAQLCAGCMYTSMCDSCDTILCPRCSFHCADCNQLCCNHHVTILPCACKDAVCGPCRSQRSVPRCTTCGKLMCRQCMSCDCARCLQPLCSDCSCAYTNELSEKLCQTCHAEAS